MREATGISVTSDVRRDLLASAAAFKTEAAVVWEYVANSLQYIERGISPKVQVTLKPRLMTIEVSDNGSGMDAKGLEHFFRMHGENLERLRGRPGRGKFGTGKSASFGIAKRLHVDTRRGGLRNVVELTREMIDASKGDEIPISWRVRNEETDLPNGTTVTIGEVVLERLNTSAVIEYIERHLQAYRTVSPEVAVNDHLCEYREPEVQEDYLFRPSQSQADVIGEVQLCINVAKAPLPEEDQGVAITSAPGSLVAVERAGVERKEFGSYLFGSVEVPRLEKNDSPLEAYDSSRSLALNPAHPVSSTLISFIGAKLEEVRAKLVARAREARKSEQTRRLAREADKIAEILNKDFETVRHRLQEIRAASASRGPASSPFGNSGEGGQETGEWVAGVELPGELFETNAGEEGRGRKGRKPPMITPSGYPSDSGSGSVDPAGGSSGRRRKPRGGFKVEYKNLGKDELRSVYDSSALTILINLDHPVVAAALGDGNVEDTGFKRLSYEVAFSEYAMALGYETAREDPDIPADDLLYEVRASLNRVSVAAASLYRS
jgi:hypothetical protein